MMTRELVFAKFRQRAGWVLSFRFFLVLCSLEPGYLSIAAAQVTFTTFDAPGAGANQNQGTAPVAINPAGAITGYYIDANWGGHGFLRAPDGTFTTFDVPGSNSANGAGTVPASINSSGTVTGTYFVNLNISHCFVRNAADGTIVALDDPPKRSLLHGDEYQRGRCDRWIL
ncbi:MAG: hypothetical protein DMG58_23295 [Acidobacteria bacterium]|nr:MAG: hypothetical protein DMG58_23295 [Acidobacteriota bacterium]